MIDTASDILNDAQRAGVSIFVEGNHLRAVTGMWWMQDMIDAVWEHELEIVALLATPDIFRLVRHVIEVLPTFIN